MTRMTVEYQGTLRCSAIHEASGNALNTDAPKDNHGKGENFSPTDLAAVSLLSCMITVMAIAAKNHDFEIGEIKGEIEKHMVSNPRRIASLPVVLRIEEMGYSDKQRRILELAAKECPVALSLHPDVSQPIEFIYF